MLCYNKEMLSYERHAEKLKAESFSCLEHEAPKANDKSAQSMFCRVLRPSFLEHLSRCSPCGCRATTEVCVLCT